MKLKRTQDDRQWVVLEEGYPYALRLTKEKAEQMVNNLNINTNLNYTIFYDAYYQFIEYYSDFEKEQINRLIP